VPIVLKSGSLSLLEPSGPVQACNGIALPLRLHNIASTGNVDYFEKVEKEANYFLILPRNILFGVQKKPGKFQYLSTLSHNRHDYRKNIEHKIRVLNFSTTFI
jgi:hypothetical protein